MASSSSPRPTPQSSHVVARFSTVGVATWCCCGCKGVVAAGMCFQKVWRDGCCFWLGAVVAGGGGGMGEVVVGGVKM